MKNPWHWGLGVPDIVFLTIMLAIIAWGIDEIRTDRYGMDFLINVQATAYEKGYQDGMKEGSLATVYLCRDWIPTVGYKAWRQCNMDYVLQQELEESEK